MISCNGHLSISKVVYKTCGDAQTASGNLFFYIYNSIYIKVFNIKQIPNLPFKQLIMVPQIRRQYNEQFTKEKYTAFLKDLNGTHGVDIAFRVAETPIFIPKDFTQKALAACESIIDVITQPAYQQQSDRAIPPNVYVPN